MESINTDEHDLTRSHPVSEQQLKAVFLRANGNTYQDVSRALEVPVNTIKNWFRPHTRVRYIYDQYSQQVAREIGTEALQKMRVLVETASSTLESALLDKETPLNLKCRVAMYLLDKTLPLVQEEEKIQDDADFALIEMEMGTSIKDVLSDKVVFNKYKEIHDRVRSGRV